MRLPDGFLFLIYIYLFFIYLFDYFWLCWVFVAARRLSLVAAGGGLLFVEVCGLLMRWLLVVAHRLSSCGARA